MPRLYPIRYLEAISEGLCQAMDLDKSVFVLGEGVDNVTGIYGILLPVYEKFKGERMIDTPISENGISGIATGAALRGLRPVLFFQRNDFMMLAMDQLMNHAAKIKFISNGRFFVPLTIVGLVARKPGEGPQHSQSLQAIFAHFPGIKVVMPANPIDAKGLLTSAIEDNDPVLILYHRDLFEEKDIVPDNYYKVPIGEPAIVKSGDDISIVAVSVAVKDAIEASDFLKTQRINPKVVDLRSVKPINKKKIIDSVKKTGRLIVVDTSWKSFSLSAEILALVGEAGNYLKALPKRIALPDISAPASRVARGFYYPSAKMISNAVVEVMASRSKF